MVMMILPHHLPTWFIESKVVVVVVVIVVVLVGMIILHLAAADN